MKSEARSPGKSTTFVAMAFLYLPIAGITDHPGLSEKWSDEVAVL
jgi:hypothetical protein